MQAFFSSKSTETGRSPLRILLSFALPVALLVAFVCSQWISFDSIGLSNGFSHPLTGWDHLLTMLAVGIWAAQLRGHAIWMLPMAFVSVMSLGGLAGAAGIDVPSVEGIILLSCAVFSVLITRKVRFSAKVNVIIVAFFGFFHGFAHGQEISTSASLISYTMGFMLATLLLHGAGILVAKLIMFAITCLLTVLFSSAALASAAQSRFELDDRHSDFAQPNLVSQTTTLFELMTGPLTRVDQQGAIASDPSGGNLSASIPQAEHLNQFSPHWMALSKSLVTASGDHLSMLVFQVEDRQCLSDDFKHYFPDINQTPGKQLLSNGVGLTSPPADQHSSSSAPVLPPRFKRLVFSAEEPLVHWQSVLLCTRVNHASNVFARQSLRDLPHSHIQHGFALNRCLNTVSYNHSLTPSRKTIRSWLSPVVRVNKNYKNTGETFS